jgi:hypothetical protein
MFPVVEMLEMVVVLLVMIQPIKPVQQLIKKKFQMKKKNFFLFFCWVLQHKRNKS